MALVMAACLAVSTSAANDAILYESQWSPEPNGLDAWSIKGADYRVAVDEGRGPVLAYDGGAAELKLEAEGGRLIHVRLTITTSANLSVAATPLAGAARMGRMALSGYWTFFHPKTNPDTMTFGFVLPEEADGFLFHLSGGGRVTVSGVTVVDRGPPPDVEPDGRERLPDPGWEAVPERASLPRESRLGGHRNGWMGWMVDRLDAATVTHVASRVRSGDQALMVTASGAGFRYHDQAKRELGVQLNRCYDFSLWAKGYGKVQLHNVGYGSSPSFVVSSDEWRQFHLPVCVDNPTHAQFSPGVLVEGRVFLDDFSFREIERTAAVGLRRSCAQWSADRLPARLEQAVPPDEQRARDTVVLENEHVRAVLSPVGGGHVVEFHDKTAETLHWRNVSLLAFLFGTQPVPIDWSIPFATEVSEDGTRVTFRHTVTGGDAAPFLDGLRIEQSFLLPADARVLSARFRLANTSSGTRLPVPRVANSWPADAGLDTLSAYGSKLSEKFVLQAASGDAGLFRTSQEQIRIEQPIEGWAAAGGGGRSLVFGFDARTAAAEVLDPAARTMSWSYPRLTLPPGGVWSADAFLASVPMDGVAYADRRVVAAVRLNEDTGASAGLRLALDTVGLVPGMRVHARVIDYENRPISAVGPDTGQTVFTPPAGHFITRLDMTGAGAAYSVELFNDPPGRVAGSGIHGAGTVQYTPVVPVRVIRLPDAGDHRRTIASAGRVLWGYGLFSHLYPFETILQREGFTVARQGWGTGFPEELNELLDFRLVILSNLGAAHLSAAQRAALSQYVRSGGSLLVTGGLCGLGNAGTAGSDLEDLLPARVSGPFEVQPVAADERLLQPAAGLESAGLAWEDGPAVYWLHRVAPRPESVLLARIGRTPALMEWTCGRGRVLLFAGTVEGEGDSGETPAWEWSGWPGFWQQILAQLLNADAVPINRQRTD